MKLAHPFQKMTTRELQMFHEQNKQKSGNDPVAINHSRRSENNHKKHAYQHKGKKYEQEYDHAW